MAWASALEVLEVLGGDSGDLDVDRSARRSTTRHPLLGAWVNGSVWFCTGEGERRATNLSANAPCVITTGRSDLDGLEAKYRSEILSPSGTWAGLGEQIRDGHRAVHRVVPSTAFGFQKGDGFSQTGWRFAAGLDDERDGMPRVDDTDQHDPLR